MRFRATDGLWPGPIAGWLAAPFAARPRRALLGLPLRSWEYLQNGRPGPAARYPDSRSEALDLVNPGRLQTPRSGRHGNGCCRKRDRRGPAQATKRQLHSEITLISLSFAGKAAVSCPPMHPTTPKTPPGRISRGSAPKRRAERPPESRFSGPGILTVPGESAGVSADTRPRSRRRHLKRLWSCRSRRPLWSTRGGFGRSQLLGLGAAPI